MIFILMKMHTKINTIFDAIKRSLSNSSGHDVKDIENACFGITE
jgi:hypothetical protein